MTAEQANRARRDKMHASESEELDGLETRSRDVESFDEDDNDGPDNDRAGNVSDESQSSKTIGLALGAFSIGLGLAEILMPRTLARAMGIKPSVVSSTTLRLFGLREIAAGVGMVMQPQKPAWAWGRVAGDALDFAFLTRASQSHHNQRSRVKVAAAVVLGVAALDIARAQQLRPRIKPRAERMSESNQSATVAVRRSVTVLRPVEEVYGYWRDFENLPQFMQHLESVTVSDDGKSQWKAKAPVGMTVSWTAEVVEDEPNAFISWQSTPDSQIQNFGSVRFENAPGDRGTEVHVELHYTPPAGSLGRIVAKMFGEEPKQQVSEDLRRFKQVLETGEILVSDASLHSGMHPAQPSADPPESAPFEAEQKILVDRAVDASNQSSNRERELPERSDDWYNNELANERSTF